MLLLFSLIKNKNFIKKLHKKKNKTNNNNKKKAVNFIKSKNKYLHRFLNVSITNSLYY